MHHRFWVPTYNGNHEFKIKNGNDSYVVDFKNLTCTCRHWEISGIPCPHSISEIYFRNEDPEKYTSRSFKVEMTKSVYGHCLKAFNGEKYWRKIPYDKFLPPRLRRMPGRPKKQRNREPREARRKIPAGISNKGRQMKCSKCEEYGHTKKTCKGHQCRFS